MSPTPPFTVTGDRFWMEELGEVRAHHPRPGAAPAFIPDPMCWWSAAGSWASPSRRPVSSAGIRSVLLIEAGHLGSGATSGAAGLLLPDAHQGRDPAPLVELGRASLDRWRVLEASTPGGIGLVDVDWFGLAPFDPAFVADPPPTVRWLDAAEVRHLVPSLGGPPPAA